MEPEFIAVPEDLIKALLKFRCPKTYKELMLVLISFSGTYQTTHREVQFSTMSEFLKMERYKIKKCLDKLVECRMLKETTDSRFPKARCLVINSNYNEWTYSKSSPNSDL
ncbi:MAG: hypothetical protein ACM3S2_18885 [Ignavibacteriales bacterium]